MSSTDEVARLIHREIEHFQGIAFGGNRIALLMALSSYVRWSSKLLPHSEDVVWLREELDDALEKYRTGQSRTLGEAFGVPDRNNQKLQALQHKYGELKRGFDDQAVGSFLHTHDERLASLDRAAFVELGQIAGAKAGADTRSQLRCLRRGCAAFLLHNAPTGSRYAAAVAVWTRVVADKELRKFVESSFNEDGVDAVGQIVGVSGGLVRKWYYEARQLDLYWQVLYRVLDDKRISWDDAYREAAERGGMSEKQARAWFEKGEKLARTPA